MPEASSANSPQEALEKPSAGLLPHPFRQSILFFCTATFFYWASLYLYVPVLPIYAQHLGASLTMVGAVVASYAIAQLMLRIPIGVGADALGRRKPLVAAGMGMAVVGAVGLGLAPDLWSLFAARAITGIAAATWVAFTVLFASYYPREGTGRAIGLISFVNGAALVVATASGGAMAQVWGFRATFLGATFLGMLALVALLPAREPAIRRSNSVSWANFFRVASHPLLLTVSAMSILVHFVNFAGVFGFIPVYATKIGASRADLGIITMLALGSAAVAALAAPYLGERWGYPTTIIVGGVLLGTAHLAIPFIQRVGLLEVVQVVNGLGRGVLSTTLMALSIRDVDSEHRATAMGVYQAIYSVGMLLGPLISGFLADSLGLASIFYLSASLGLALAAMAYLPILPRR